MRTVPILLQALTACRTRVEPEIIDPCPNQQTKIFYPDEDGDGFGDSFSNGTLKQIDDCTTEHKGWVLNQDDCDDTSHRIYPGADESLDTFIDNDCDNYTPIHMDWNDWRVNGDPQAELGRIIEASQDVTDDSFNDLILGLPNADSDNGDTWAGEAVLITGGTHFYANKPNLYANRRQGSAAFEFYGYSVTSGDYNGDGISDISLSAPYGAYEYGYVEILDGSRQLADELSTKEAQTLYGKDTEHYGTAIDSGDFNGDGYIDLIIGAPEASAEERYAGRIELCYGPNFKEEDCITTYGEAAYDNLGEDLIAIQDNGTPRILTTKQQGTYGPKELVFLDAQLNQTASIQAGDSDIIDFTPYDLAGDLLVVAAESSQPYGSSSLLGSIPFDLQGSFFLNDVMSPGIRAKELLDNCETFPFFNPGQTLMFGCQTLNNGNFVMTSLNQLDGTGAKDLEDPGLITHEFINLDPNQPMTVKDLGYPNNGSHPGFGVGLPALGSGGSFFVFEGTWSL